MKKLNKLLVIGLLFLSASACQQTAVLKEDYISFFNYVLTSGKACFNDSLYNLSLTIDTNSYIDNNTEITYYYLPFMKKYQLYDDEVIKVSDEINYGLDLYKLVNIVNTSDFISSQDGYQIKEDKLTNYQLSYFDKDVTSLNFYYDKASDSMTYNFLFSDNQIGKVVVAAENVRIHNFYYVSEENFYFNNMLNQTELRQKIARDEDFILVISNDTCSACQRSEGAYYEFTLEYPDTEIKIIDLEDLNGEYRKLFLTQIQTVYNQEDSSLHLTGYDTYDNYLTPTNIRFKNGEISFVTLGMSMGNEQFTYIALN